MEEGVRSAGVVKKKNSSGCLIIKKKGDILGSGVGSSHKEKKRARVLMNEPTSSDESLQPIRRRVNDKKQNGSLLYGRRVEEDREFRMNGDIIETERKRSRMDLFEFDEYDEFDGKIMRNEYAEMVGRDGSSREFGGGSGRNATVEKRKHAYFDSSSSGMSGRNKAVDYVGKRRFDLDGDEAHLPISLLRLKYQEESDKAIRLQGKNGVLKVMVNKKKKMDLSSSKNYNCQIVENRKGARSENSIKEESRAQPSFYSDSKRTAKKTAFTEREQSQLNLQKQMLVKHGKSGDSELKLKTPLIGKSSKAEDHESDGTDTSLKLAPPCQEAGSSKKAAKREGKRSLLAGRVATIKGREKKTTPPVDAVTPVKGSEGKVKRGGSTEKQLLRERIREMLTKAGWTIDYRPRRNRDYLDAVYVNPGGTAYWSIIKAYDALQKQLQEENDKNKIGGVSSSFAPLSDDLINKLTRQTRKKVEEEMKKKRRNNAMTKKSKKAVRKNSAEDSDTDHHEERLSSFIRQNGKSKKGRLHEVDCESGDDLSDDSSGQNPEQHNAGRPSTKKSNVVQGRKSRKIGRCTLLVRSSVKGPNSESDGYVPYTGKRTLLARLIDSGTVQLSEKVQYMSRRRTRVKLEGWITREGIHCGCCSKILTVSKFELHAGSKLRQPFQNIVLESGPSLLQCLIDAWNKQADSGRLDFYVVDVDGDDPDDDTCGICGDGGDLICCDGCPSTFHQSCLGIQMLPSGDWHCPNCTCKFCGTATGNFTEDDGTANEPLTCNLCEKKYHRSCSKEMVAPLVMNNPATTSFCGKKCHELYDHLQKILGVKNELDAGFSWSLIQRTDLESETAQHVLPQRVECNSKLAVALSVMDECFLPIVDRRSGINLIHNVLYNCGSNFSRLNYRGFYTVILERGDEVISAASLRIHGTQLAEMPFIGTRPIYRRQGMCRRLLSAIESLLCSFKVEKLIIPAISEHMHTWTVVFGFKQLEESHKKEMKSLSMLVFPGTDMLQKQLSKQEIPEGMEVIESKANYPKSPALIEKRDPDSSENQERSMQGNVGVEHMIKIINKDAVHSVLPAPPVPLNDITVSSTLDSTHESDTKFLSKENACFEAEPVKEPSESSNRLKFCSSPRTATKPLEMKNADLPLTEDLARDAGNGKVLCSDSVEDVLGEASQNMANEVENPVSVPTACDTSDTYKQDEGEDNPTVVEMRVKLHTSSESPDGALPIEADRGSLDESASAHGAAPDVVEESACIEHRHSAFQETSLQNATEKASGRTFASVTAPSIRADAIIQFNSDLNQPIAVDVESESQFSSETHDSKASANGKFDLRDGKLRISTATDVNDDDSGAHVKASCSETTTNFSEEVASDKELEKIRNSMEPCSGSVFQCTDVEVKDFNSDLSNENMEEAEHASSVVSVSDSVAEVHSSKLQNSCGASIKGNAKGTSVKPIINSSTKISPWLTAEKLKGSQKSELLATSDGASQSSVLFSPDLNQQAALVEAALIGASGSVSTDTVALAETAVRIGVCKLNDSRKVNVVTAPALGSPVASIPNTKETE